MAKTPDIEKLVERAYRDIEPPAYVAEELAESLPATRVRPRRAWVAMLAWPAAAAAIVGGVIWLQQRGNGEPSSGGMLGPDQLVDNRRLDVAEIWVRADGRVMILIEGTPAAWKCVSLDALGEHLEERGQAYDAQMRKEKKSGYDTLRGGMTVSRVQVRIKADADAPWLYLQWIMTVCAQKRFPKLVFVKDNEIVDVPLPADLGLLRGVRQTIKIRIDVRPMTADPFFGPRRSSSVYSFNRKTTTEISEVAKWIDAAHRAAVAGTKATVVGEIRGSAKAPYSGIVELVKAFHAQGLKRVQFHGTALPDARVRQARQLPQLTADPRGWWPRKADKPFQKGKPQQVEEPEKIEEEEIEEPEEKEEPEEEIEEPR